MLKFKITPDRFAEACNIIEYLAVSRGNTDTAGAIAHRFLLDKDGEYVVRVKLDEDGDIAGLENDREAFVMMSALTPKRLEKLASELTEAAKAIVNPPNKGG